MPAIRPHSPAALRILAVLALLGLAACGAGTPVDSEGYPLPAPASAAADDAVETAGERAGVPADAAQASLSAGTPVEAVDPGTVIGQSRAQIGALLGPPLFVRRDGSAEFWRYRHSGCILELYFYPRDGKPALDHMETRGPVDRTGDRASEGSGEARCLGALIAAHRKKG